MLQTEFNTWNCSWQSSEGSSHCLMCSYSCFRWCCWTLFSLWQSSVFLMTITTLTKMLVWSRLQEKNSLIINAETSPQCSLSSVILNVKSWSSVDCYGRFFLSLKKYFLGRSYQYLSVLFLALLLSEFWAQVCLANPSIVSHLLVTCPSLSYSFFPYHLIYPLLSLGSW